MNRFLQRKEGGATNIGGGDLARQHLIIVKKGHEASCDSVLLVPLAKLLESRTRLRMPSSNNTPLEASKQCLQNKVKLQKTNTNNSVRPNVPTFVMNWV